jgi:SPP1 gp7 family putative phage head morphogenesis protein
MNYRTWILTLDKFEVMLRGRVALERNRFLRAAARSYENNLDIAASVKKEHERKLGVIILSHYNKVMPHFVKVTRKEKKQREFKASSFDGLIAEWASTEALRKAKLISDTDIDDVLGVISDGMLEGSTIPEITKGIRNKAGLTAYRASVVARTETHNAATYASIQSVKEIEQETGVRFMKQWIATNDDRTRDSHRDMIGSDPIPTDDKFYVNGEWMDRPGDSSASPENIINCRCQVIFSEQ